MVLVANIISIIAGICSIASVYGKDKNQIVYIEYMCSILRMISNSIVKSWSDVIAKFIKCLSQCLMLADKLDKFKVKLFIVMYLLVSLTITFVSKDYRCLIAIVPSVIEFYALLVPSTKMYRQRVILTKVFWTINNLVFKLYVGIIFDFIVVIGHIIKNKKAK